MSLIPQAVQDLIQQSIVSAIWKRPEVAPLREPIESALQSGVFASLLQEAFAMFAERSQAELPEFFNEGYLRMPAVLDHLSAYVVEGKPADLDELAAQYAKRHLQPAQAPDVRQLLEGYLRQLRETLSSHPAYGPLLLARDVQSMAVSLRALVEDSRRQTTATDDMKSQLTRIETRLELILREPEVQALIQRKTGRHIFLSYSRKDLNRALRVRNALADQGHAVWQDLSSIKGGELWLNAIDNGIKQANAVVIVLSSAAWASYWVREEFTHAQRHAKTIIPVNIDGCEIPFGLNQLNPIDAHTNFEVGLLRLGDALPANAQADSAPAEAPATTAPPDVRALEIDYLNRLLLEYSVWKQLYTPMAGVARTRKQPERRAARQQATSITPEYLRKRIRETFAEAEPLTEEKVENIVTVVNRVRHLVVLGEPGSGKSTTLWTLANQYAEAALTSADAPLPVLISLGAMEGITSIQQQIARQLGEPLAAALPAKRLAILLDALNELPTENQQAWLTEIRVMVKAAQAEDRILVVTCRELDYERGLDLGIAERVTITPLDPVRIHDFCIRYLPDEGDSLFWGMAGAAAERFWQAWQHERNGDFATLWSSDDICKSTSTTDDHFMAELRTAMQTGDRSRQLLVLARNPYMLYMMTQVFDETGELPPNRGKLFDLFTDILLLERERLPVEQAETLRGKLAKFAFTLRREGLGTSVGRSAVEGFLNADELHQALSANLLEGADEIRFSHELLNEYFAARRLDQERLNGTPATTFWKPEAWWEGQTAWDETAILLAGLYSDDCTPVLEWLQEAQPELTARCIMESGAHTPPQTLLTLKDAWLPRLTDLESDPRPEARAAVGRALGRLRLDDRPGVGLRDGLPAFEWCHIPADKSGSTFTFGEGEATRQLAISYDYWLSKYPVTYAQFEAFVNAGESGYRNDAFWTEAGLGWRGEKTHPEAYWNDPRWHISNHPVVGVTWYEAQAFCAWLTAQSSGNPSLPMGERTGVRAFRLPTEAEWEKAARYPDARRYPWEPDYISGYANINETEQSAGPHYLRRTSPVGIYPQGANPQHGAHDLSGNVWEWCLSKWAAEYTFPEDNQPEGDARRCLRGGSWSDHIDLARAASRGRSGPNYRFSYIGFRVVWSSPISVLLSSERERSERSGL